MSKDFTSQINKILFEYKDQTSESMRKIIETVASDTVSELQSTSPKKTGKYASSWKKKRVKSSKGAVNIVIYNERYQLTHLLEKGHATRGGGRTTKAQPHIAPAEERAEKSITEQMQRGL